MKIRAFCLFYSCSKCVLWNSYFLAELIVLFQKGIHFSYKVDIN